MEGEGEREERETRPGEEGVEKESEEADAEGLRGDTVERDEGLWVFAIAACLEEGGVAAAAAGKDEKKEEEEGLFFFLDDGNRLGKVVAILNCCFGWCGRLFLMIGLIKST